MNVPTYDPGLARVADAMAGYLIGGAVLGLFIIWLGARRRR